MLFPWQSGMHVKVGTEAVCVRNLHIAEGIAVRVEIEFIVKDAGL